jgi:methylamine dehydrogenase accessory protein MauD
MTATGTIAMSDAFLASYIALWALLVLAFLGIAGMARQVGLLTRRLPREMTEGLPGPALGETVLPIRGETFDGTPISIEPEFSARTLLVFTSDDCDTCNRVLPDIARTLEDMPDLDAWLVYGQKPEPDHFARRLLAERALVAGDAFREWDIGSVPYGFIATETGRIVAKGHLPHVEHLRTGLGLAPVNAEDSERYKEAWEHEPAGQTA